MPFARTALLKPDVETALAKQMLPLWRADFTAEQIMKELDFGEPFLVIKHKRVDNPYIKLQKFHVWNYRTKFNKGKEKHLKRFKNKFKPREGHGIPKGQSRYKDKQDETMSFTEFRNTLDAELPLIEGIDQKYCNFIQRKRAFLITLFWCPLRKSEVYERVEKDFKIMGDALKINLYRKKKYYKLGAKTEPFFLKLQIPLVNEVVNWVLKSKKEWKVPLVDKEGNIVTDDNGKPILNRHPFNFNSWTAWHYVKTIFPNKTCHYFRFNWITKAISNARDPRYIINELLIDTGLNIQTVRSYIMDNPRFRGAINVREAELIREYEE